MASRTGRNGNGSETSQALDEILVNERMEEIVNNLIGAQRNLVTKMLDRRRDIDDECGFAKDPVPLEVYQTLFDQNPVAERFTTAMDDECWQASPIVSDSDDMEEDTDFTEAIKELASGLFAPSSKRSGNGGAKSIGAEGGVGGEEQNYFEPTEGVSNPIYLHLEEWGKKSGIGHWGVLLLGFDDLKPGSPLSDPVQPKKGRKLVYLNSFSETNAKVVEWDNSGGPRHGKPNYYEITLWDQQESLGTSVSVPGLGNSRVHWTRVLHLAKEPISNPSISRPIMRPVRRHLLNLEKLWHGSAEGYWQMGIPAYVAEIDPRLVGNAKVNYSKMKDQIEQFINTLQRFMIGNGWTLKAVSGTVQDPNPFIMAEIDAIAIKGSIPKRILLGSEQAVLAATQDAKRWEARKRGYRNKKITPLQLVPFFNRMIWAGALPIPGGENSRYRAWWPTDEHLTDTEKMDVFVKKMQGLGAAISGSVTSLLPEATILKEAGWSQEEAEQLLEESAQQQEEELKERQDLADEMGFEPAPPPGFGRPEPQEPPVDEGGEGAVKDKEVNTEEEEEA